MWITINLTTKQAYGFFPSEERAAYYAKFNFPTSHIYEVYVFTHLL